MINKLLNIICVIFLSTSIAKADYGRLKFWQVIETTDIAVIGKIVKVDIE